MRVLVVDDDFLSLRAAKRVMREHEVLLASDQNTALEKAAKHQPEAIVLDVKLGNESGLELISALRFMAPQAAVIIMSGSPAVELRRIASANRAHAFVEKIDLLPLPALAARLVSALRRRGPRLPLTG